MTETDTPFLDTHLNIALSLYNQRESCLEQKYVQAPVQHAIEKRLLVHLHVLSQSIEVDASEPKDDADLFVYLSTRLISKNKEHQDQALLVSKQIMSQHAEPKGLIVAFILFYNDDIHSLLSDLFNSNKDMRSTIIVIWKIKGQQIPQGLLNQSELQNQNNELQATVLNYHAEQQSIGLPLFQNYYRSILDSVKKENLIPNVINAAIWGGMIREDKDILIVIRRAIELEPNIDERAKFLRLAALNGNVGFLPIFSTVSETNPEIGSYLIALLGTLDSIEILLSMLKNPRTSLLIIPAWTLLTGQELRAVPRISLVEDNSQPTSDNEDSDDIPLIADVRSAAQWVKKNSDNWKKDLRYIHGMECTYDNLTSLCYQLSGQFGQDINDLLTLFSKGSITAKVETWVLDKNTQLDSIQSNSTVNRG